MYRRALATLVALFSGQEAMASGPSDTSRSRPELADTPVPGWRPSFRASNEDLLARMVYYTNGQRDLVVFRYGTIVILPDGLSDSEARQFAAEVLAQIYSYHPDMNPLPMDDGNIVVQYNHPAVNVVLEDFIRPHLEEIRSRHLDGLARAEVLVTPAGPNVFDDLAMKAIYGRTFMFMDAQAPKVETVFRHTTESGGASPPAPPHASWPHCVHQDPSRGERRGRAGGGYSATRGDPRRGNCQSARGTA